MFVRGSTFRQSPRYRRRESLRGFDFEYFLNLLYRFYTPKGGFLFFVSSLSISYGYIPVNLCIYTYAFTGIYLCVHGYIPVGSRIYTRTFSGIYRRSLCSLSLTINVKYITDIQHYIYPKNVLFIGVVNIVFFCKSRRSIFCHKNFFSYLCPQTNFIKR